MNILQITNNLATLITLGFGIWAVFKPGEYSRLLLLKPYKEAGIAEIRANYGGWIIGFAGFVLWAQNDQHFICLSVAWLTTAIVRLTSCIWDKCLDKRSLLIILIEIIVATLLFI